MIIMMLFKKNSFKKIPQILIPCPKFVFFVVRFVREYLGLGDDQAAIPPVRGVAGISSSIFFSDYAHIAPNPFHCA